MSLREEFELWAEANLGLSLRRNPAGAYQSFGVYSAWEAWQASRSTCVVDLVPRVTAEECASHLEIDSDDVALDISHMINGAIIACGAMVKAAGLQVKP